MSRTRAVVFPLLLLLSTGALAGPAVYEISTNIKEGGEALASPVIRVKPGTPAEMSVSGERGYSLKVSATPTEDGAVDVVVSINTNRTSLRSVVTTLPGKPIGVSAGDIAVDVTVREGGG